MLENHVYNLMMQLVQENKSLWRINEHYMNDSDCDSCREFWENLAAQKSENIRDLEMLISEHMEQLEIPIPT
jgi:hypothetical protein